jgi:hypothetical protein
MAWRGRSSGASWRRPDPEPLLRLEEVSPANQIGGEGMSKPVEADGLQASLVPKFCEPVAESAGGQAPTVVQVPGERPFTEFVLAGGSSQPGRLTEPPQLDCRSSQRQPAHRPGFGGANLFP